MIRVKNSGLENIRIRIGRHCRRRIISIWSEKMSSAGFLSGCVSRRKSTTQNALKFVRRGSELRQKRLSRTTRVASDHSGNSDSRWHESADVDSSDNEMPLVNESMPSADEAVFDDEQDGNGFPDLNELVAALPVDESSTRREWLLIALTMICRHNASREKQQMIIDALRLSSGKQHIPATTFLFWKEVKSVAGVSPEVHFVCKSCRAYIDGAPYPMKARQADCGTCGMTNTLNAGNDNNLWFFYIPLRSCLPEFLASCGRKLDYKIRRQIEPDIISDVYDGILYKTLPLRHTGLDADNPQVDITLSLNIDGTPAFPSRTPGSIEAMQVEVLELPPGLRASNTLPIASWFGQRKEEGFSAQALLAPLVEELLELKVIPIVWHYGNKTVESRVLLHSIVVDAMARFDILGMRTFHSIFGCHVCFHPGERVPVSPGSQYTKQTYPYNDCHTLLRNRASLEHDAQLATDALLAGQEPDAAATHGVKMRTILLRLDYLDLPACVLCEPMHVAMEGEVKRLYQFHICRTKGRSDADLYVAPPEMRLLEREFFKNKPGYPSGITRHLQSFQRLGYFKASQFGLLLFFGHMSIFEDLQEDHLDHFASLSVAMHLLHDDHITMENLTLAEELLQDYVSRHEQFFGSGDSTYNMHQLLHMARTVFLAGPLSKLNAFGFENTQRYLKSTIKSFNGPLVQLLHGLEAEFAARSLGLSARAYLKPGEDRSDFISKWSASAREATASCVKLSASAGVNIEEDLENFVRIRCGNVNIFERAEVPGMHVLETRRSWRVRLSKRRQNSKLASCFVVDDTGEYFVIRAFFSCANNENSASAIVERVEPDEEGESNWALSLHCNQRSRISCVGSTQSSCLEVLPVRKIRYHVVVLKHSSDHFYHLVRMPMVYGMW